MVLTAQGERFFPINSNDPPTPISVLKTSSKLDDGGVPHEESVQETGHFPLRVTIRWRIKKVGTSSLAILAMAGLTVVGICSSRS